MQLINRLKHFNTYQQAIILLSVIRLVAGTLVMMLLFISVQFGWGVSSVNLDWPLVFVSFSCLLILSIGSYVKRYDSVNQSWLFCILLVDAFFWCLFLNQTGGAMNPAISYFLILLLLSTLVLPLLRTLFIFSFILILYTGLMLVDPHSLHSMMGWHLWGMWLLFFFTAIIIMVSVHWLSVRIRLQDQAINTFKEQTFRSEQLVMMGTMAASAAHELATPLSTIALLAEDSDHTDADLILLQIERCKKSLQQLKHIPDQATPTVLHSYKFLNALKQDILLIKPRSSIDIVDEADAMLAIPLTLRQALLALMVNAIDAARKQIVCTLYIHADKIIWQIYHDGSPIDEFLLEALGVEWVSSKENGLGIGYFLANASIESLEGKVQVSNQSTGVVTRVELPCVSVLIDHE